MFAEGKVYERQRLLGDEIKEVGFVCFGLKSKVTVSSVLSVDRGVAALLYAKTSETLPHSPSVC